MIHMTINSFDSPAKAIQELISWHISVGRDPKVNGGRVMVDVELNQPIRSAIETYVQMRYPQENEHYRAAHMWKEIIKVASKGRYDE